MMDILLAGSVWNCWWLAPLALVMDLLLGDPPLPWPHPVCAQGRLLNFLEKLSRQFMDQAANARAGCLRGLACGFASLFLCAGASFCIVLALELVPWAGTLFMIYFAWAGLAMGCLLRTGKEVLRRVETFPAKQARQAVSWLVTRETGAMDRQTLRKTLADTLAENFTDAFMAPFFWLLIGGPAVLWCYKAVSTMDSQWGYMTPKWRNLGFAGAKSDDVLAWVPARISIIVLFCADFILRKYKKIRLWQGRWPGFARVYKDSKGMPSPNSGCSMAACAWLCGSRMAGPSIYFGEMVHKEWLGPGEGEAAPWDEKRLAALCRLMLCGAIAGGFLTWLCACLIRWLASLA